MSAELVVAARRPNQEERQRKQALAELLQADLAWLVMRHPFTASLALHLEMVPVCDSRVPTAATDGRHVYFHIGFADTLDAAERRFVLAHEVWHCALDHSHRRGERDGRLWGLAADSEVNGLLARDGLPMPHHAVHFARMDESSAEQIYSWLRDDPDAQDMACSFDIHDLLAQPGGPQDGEWVADPDFSPGPPPDDLLRREWGRRLGAAQARAGAFGNLPEGVACRITAARGQGKRPVPWQAVLREHLQRCCGGSFSYARVARRHLWRQAWLPGRRGDALELMVGLDTSGSTSRLLGVFLAELQAITCEFAHTRLTLVECDAEVHRVTRVTEDDFGDWAHRIRRKGLLGGGGTDFRPVFELAARESSQALLFFTDGFGEAPQAAPGFAVIWALAGDGAQAPVPWGAVVRVGTSDG